MKKILVVDDVPVIVQSIKKMLEEEYTIEVIEAGNGEDALIKLQEYSPDILITDVKMPNKDGISLIKEIREKGSKIPIVVISGFKEFEHVEKALNMGVIGYIVKPISKKQLYDVMNKIINLFEENKWKGQLTNEIRRFKKQKSNELIESQLYNVLLGKNIEIDKNTKQYGEMEDSYHAIYIIKMLEDVSKELGFNKKDKDLIDYSLKNIILEIAEKHQAVYIEHKEVESCNIVLLKNNKEIVLKYSLWEMAEEIYKLTKELLGLEIRVGISGVHKRVSNELYKEAQLALQSILFNTNSPIEEYKEYTNQHKPVDTLMDLLELSIKSCEYKKIEDLLDKMLDEGNEYIKSVQQLRYALSRIYTFIYESIGKETKKQIDVDFFKDSYLLQVKSLEEIKQEILQQVKHIFYLKGISIEQEYKNNIVERVHTYIEQNIDRNISIKDLADLCGMHYNYFSSLFKKLTDKSAVQYITDIRMKKAIKLLEEGNEVIAEISLMVGYTDIQYFYKTFKKYTGKTPLSYRNKK